MFAFSNIINKHRFADQPKRELRFVTFNLSVERWVPINEVDCKAEFVREKVTRRIDVGDEQLRGGGTQNGARCSLFALSGHGMGSGLERLPSLEPQLTCDKFLRVH